MPIKDKEKNKEYHKKYYIKEKSSMLGSQTTRWKTAQLYINEKKLTPCVDCGFVPQVPDQMDFDHVKGNKLDTVARMVTKGASLEKLKEEIEKCEIVCSNCHRLRTYKRRNNMLL
jgi:Pyruvate/2-oxoacid:ferredoxin oxidoreductase delta subunit